MSEAFKGYVFLFLIILFVVLRPLYRSGRLQRWLKDAADYYSDLIRRLLEKNK